MAIGTPVNCGSAVLTSSATTTVPVTLAASIAVGDLIIVTVCNDGGANLPTAPTDSKGHTYTADEAGALSTNNYSHRQFSTVCTSAMTSAVDTVTGNINGGGGNWDKVITVAKSTPDTGRTWGASRIDQTAAATGNSTAPDSGVVATTTDNDELAYGSMAAGGAPSNTGGGPLTAATNGNTRLHNVQGGAFIDSATVYQVLTSTGTPKASGTWQASDQWRCVEVTYKQEAIGGGGTPVRTLGTLGVGT